MKQEAGEWSEEENINIWYAGWRITLKAQRLDKRGASGSWVIKGHNSQLVSHT